MADRIREAAGQVAINLSGTRLGYSVSVGLVEVGSADDMVTLLRNAEIALDAGHLRGGNCLFHHDGQRCRWPCPTRAGRVSRPFSSPRQRDTIPSVFASVVGEYSRGDF